MSAIDEQYIATDFPVCTCDNNYQYLEGYSESSPMTGGQRLRIIFLHDFAPIVLEGQSPKVFYFRGASRVIPPTEVIKSVKSVRCGYCQKKVKVDFLNLAVQIARSEMNEWPR